MLDSSLVTRYELLDRIGVGGMAEIFRGKAVAAGGFEKPVAIKRILPHLSQDKRFVELLIAEAKVLSLLKHRNIVQIFDVGLGDDGQYFLVMEYVDGKDLGAVQRGLETRRGRMPFDLALHVGAEICEALEHAHSARAPDGKSMSLVHRDVSPSNVLMSRAGETKLTDFGIAKRAEQEATGHGAVRGKFAYISPEQARNEHLDPRSDVFSVGILLWELVTNRRLFSGLGDMEALRSVREAQIPRPREIDSRLSPEIDALIMLALSRDVRSRPTAGQLGAKLRTLRYALDVTVGDPATELAKIIDAAEEVERQSSQQLPVLTPPPPRGEFDGTEATVIRIHTADEFSMRDKDGTAVARAREVIDRFEEEETRQAQLSRDQMAFLRSNATRDSGELASAVEPPLPGVSPRRTTDERTRARAPIALEDAPTYLPGTIDPNQHFDADEATRLVAPSSRRTPPPERVGRPRPPTQPSPERRPRPPTQPPPERRPRLATQPPPPDRTPGPVHTPAPGTVHDRTGRGISATPSGSSSVAHPPPPSSQGMAQPPPPSMQPPQVRPPQMQPPQMQTPQMQPPQMQPPQMQQMQPPQMQQMQPPQMQQMQPPQMQQMQPPQMQPPQMQPPQMQPPQMQPPQMQPPQMQPGFPTWGRPPMGPAPGMSAMPGMYERPVVQRPSTAGIGPGRPRRSPVKPWMLMIGAFIMALLAFAVTRACIHTATNKPAAETK
jgi:serine/threonine protein kinase